MQDGQKNEYDSNLKNYFIENDPFLSSVISNVLWLLSPKPVTLI